MSFSLTIVTDFGVLGRRHCETLDEAAEIGNDALLCLGCERYRIFRASDHLLIRAAERRYTPTGYAVELTAY